MKSILYTCERHNVSICHPAPSCLALLQAGGLWGKMTRGEREAKVEDQRLAGHAESIAVRFIDALAFGGKTESEALEIIRDRDAAHGTAHELIDPVTLSDRWFRDAWRRAPTGGPIYIDIAEARKIQFKRLRALVRDVAEQMADDITAFDWRLDVAWDRVRDAILKADASDAIRSVWPNSNDELFPKVLAEKLMMSA